MKIPVRKITVTAVLMAANIVMSSFSVPVPGGHIYLNDVIIFTAAILLDPLCAFMVGGVGAFLGDLLFYPTPMFVSLVTHGLQAVVASLCVRKAFPDREKAGAILGMILGGIIMVAGYSFGRAYIYGTPVDSLLKLPFQIAQAAVGAVCAVLLCYRLGVKKAFNKIFGE